MPDERLKRMRNGGGTGLRYWPDLKSVAEVQAGDEQQGTHADGEQKTGARAGGGWPFGTRLVRRPAVRPRG